LTFLYEILMAHLGRTTFPLKRTRYLYIIVNVKGDTNKQLHTINNISMTTSTRSY